ncbi:hypothetical protein Esti_005016 [Eimeria stiedai]
MNSFWGSGSPQVAPPSIGSVGSPRHRRMCDEARAAAAWLWIQSEVAGAFERFSKELLAIHAQGLGAVTTLDASHLRDAAALAGSIASSKAAAEGGGGARDALNSLLLLCAETGAEANRFASALSTGVVKPVDEALQPLAHAADSTDGALHEPTGFAAAGDADVQKAARRLQLAEEELTKAEASLQELRALFGAEINSSLEQKATERISRASRLKCAAQESLRQAVAASAAKQAQGTTSLRTSHLPASFELAGSARLLVVGGGVTWAEAGGLRVEEHYRRVASAMLQSMKAAGKAALASQQRSTGFVLHYVKDMQLFAAAEMAAAGAYGGVQVEGGSPDIFSPGATEDLMRQLYPPNSGAQAASQQQTNEATLRNLLRHQEKQLQEMLKERDELRRQTSHQQAEWERQQREIARQQEELLALKQKLPYEASAAGVQQPVQEARPKLRKQVTIHLVESEDENTPWSPRQQQLNGRQGGDRGESHGRVEGGGNSTADLALRLPAVNAGNAREEEGPMVGPLPRVSPPAAGSRRPIEMTWVDVELRYEAFLLSLRSLPLSSLMPQTKTDLHQYPLQQQQQQQQQGWDGGSESRGPSWMSKSASRGVVRGPLSMRGAGGPLHWADPCCAAALAEAIEAAADAALPSFLVRCCRLAAVAASPSSRSDRHNSTRAGKASRMSVQQVQGRIQWSKRQQQQQQQDEASGRPLGPLDWNESDLQVLAYELLLLVMYHHSQYSAAAALFLDEEEAQRSNTAPSHAESSRMHLQQQQQQHEGGVISRPSRQIRRPRKSLARAMSFRRGMHADEEDDSKQQQRQPQQAEESCHADGEGAAVEAPGQQLSVSGGASRPPRKPRKSFACAMSLKRGVFPGDEDGLQQQQQQQLQQQQQQGVGVEVSDAGDCWAGKAAEGPSADLLGPCHPFSLPLEEWQRRLAGEGARVSSSSSSVLLPLRRRLQATQQWLAPSPSLQQANEDVLMQLLQLARVCFELPSASSNKLLSLLTPQVDCGLGPGASLPTFLHPCDLRFRVCRLMDAWRVALCPAATKLKPPSPPRTQQQRQQQQWSTRFLPGGAGAIGRFDAAQGMRGAIRRKVAGNTTTSADKKGRFGARSSYHPKPAVSEMTLGPDAGASPALPSGATKQQQQQQQQQQLAGDLDPPLLLQPPQEKRKSKQRVSISASLGKPSSAAARAAAPPAAAEESQKRQDPVFQAFVQRQLQLLHAAALSRCARLLKFLLPDGKAAPRSDSGVDSLFGPQEPPMQGAPLHALAWRPVQLQQLYAREQNCSDEEAFLFFLRSLLLCPDEAASPQRAPQAPAFLLYSKEETASAIVAAAQLQLLPLRLLCCFYHIFAYIFALQQLQRQQLWGEEEAFVSIEELSIRVTDYVGAPAGTGEAEPPLTWEVRAEVRERGGLQLLQLLQHNMSQAATLDAALRCSLAARGNNNPTLRQLAAASAASSPSGGEAPPTQRLQRQQSLKPVANLLELPVPYSDCGDVTDVSEGGFLSGSDVEGPERASGRPPLPGMLRSALRRPTLKALRRLTLHALEGGAGASSVAGEDVAGASVFSGGEQQSLCLPREMQLSAYWCMDVPLLLCLLLLLGKCCVDPTAANGLQLDAPSLVQGLLLVAHAAQVGTDPTCPSVDEEAATAAPPSDGSSRASACPSLVLLQAARAGSGFPGVSLESVALLVAACVWGTATGGTSGLPNQEQQNQLLQHSATTSGGAESWEPPLQQQGSAQSTGSPSTGRAAAAAQQQQQQLLDQLAVPLVPSAVHPMGAQVVSSATELLTDFCGFLKRPSADAEAEADEVAWLLGGPQAAADAFPSDPATATTTTSAAAAAGAAAAPIGGPGGTPAAGGASKADCIAAGGGNPLMHSPSIRVPTLKRQPTGALAATQPKLEGQRPGGGSSVAAAGDSRDVASASLDPGELLLRVRGERLALCLRPLLLPQGEAGAAEEELGLWAQRTVTFSGLLTRRLWLGPDWWVSDAGGRSVGDQQCGLRSSRSASFCYGLSALLPSRVELQQQEIASLQLLCSGFLARLQQQLQDYRRHFEPQVLPLALSAWRGVAQRLLLLPNDEQQNAKREHSVRGVGSGWPGAPERWTLQVLGALKRSATASGLQSGDNSLLQQDDEDEAGEDFTGGRGRRDSEEDSMAWVWDLPEILRGPSPLHDMLRCFISRSLFAAAGRLLGPHVCKILQLSGAGEKEAARRGSVLDREGDALLGTEDAGSERGGRAVVLPPASGVETEAAEDEALRGLAGGIDALRSHMQSELLLYSEVFAPLLPLRGEHALLVLRAAKAVLLSVVPLVLICVDRVAEADDDKRGLPARGGSAVLNALAAFERLTDELCLGGVLSVCLSSGSQRRQRGLVSALAPRLFASFSLHLSGLTDLLSQAFLRDVFAPANPPHALYSEKAVDGWCCIYGVVEAAFDSSLPVRWLLPRLLQFLSELTACLCRSLTDPCMSQSEGPGVWGGRPLMPLLALRQLQRACFSGLLEAKGQAATIAEAPLVEHFLALQRTLLERSAKHHRTYKGWRGRMTQLVSGWEEEGKASFGAARLGSAYLSGMEGDNSGDSSDAYEKPLPSQGGTNRGHTAAHTSSTDEEKARSRSVFQRFFGPTGSRESSLGRAGGGGHGRGEAEAAPSSGPRGGPPGGPPRKTAVGMERLSQPMLHLLAAVDTLTDWEAAREKAILTGGQRPTSGLQRWLVRLNIVSLYLQRLPGLRTKLLEEAQKRIVVRCPRDVEVVRRLRQLQGLPPGGGPTVGTNEAGGGASAIKGAPKDALQRRQEEELAEATAAVDEAVESLTQKLQETAKEICSLAAMHLVYYELQGDLFGSLYASEDGFGGMSLSRLLLAFPNTVEAFFCSAPVESQDDLASAVLLCLVEAWCLLLTEWGYGGHTFEEKEIEVLEADLDALRQYAADNEIALEEARGVFDRVNDFLVMLDADGRCLAAAGHLSRQQQDSPRHLPPPVDAQDRSRYRYIEKQRSSGSQPVSSLGTLRSLPYPRQIRASASAELHRSIGVPPRRGSAEAVSQQAHSSQAVKLRQQVTPLARGADTEGERVWPKAAIRAQAAGGIAAGLRAGEVWVDGFAGYMDTTHRQTETALVPRTGQHRMHFEIKSTTLQPIRLTLLPGF